MKRNRRASFAPVLISMLGIISFTMLARGALPAGELASGTDEPAAELSGALPETVGVRLGLGQAYGMQGVQGGGLWQVFPDIRIGPIVGLGGLLGEGQSPSRWLWALGLQLRVGDQHRLIVDIDYEPVNTREYSLHGVTISRLGLYGLGMRLGYEYSLSSGVHFQVALGPSWQLDSGRFKPVNSGVLAIGYRLGVGG